MIVGSCYLDHGPDFDDIAVFGITDRLSTRHLSKYQKKKIMFYEKYRLQY